MSEKTAELTTNVTGYYNPNSWPIYVEISEVNLKCELKPGQYIRDRDKQYINDPILEDYVQPKGLGRTMGDHAVPIRYLPRMVRTVRPVHSVTQATGFVRQSDGSVVPSYTSDPLTSAPETPINKNPIVGMTVAKARELGLIGKPRVLPEDYGVTDTTGAPSPSKDLPTMKYSLESPPKLRTAAPLSPELMEADQRLTPQQAAQRAQIQQNLARAAATAPPEAMDPGAYRPPPNVPIRAPKEPTRMAPPAAQPVPVAPQRVLPRRVAAVVVQEPAPAAVEGAEPELDPEDQGGMLQPITEGEGMPEPTLDDPQVNAAGSGEGGETKRFVCAADGKPFKYRSELERYVKRKYPNMLVDLMKPYPPEG